jgi:hypothetical protein
MRQHLFGVRNLAAAHPDTMKGAAVFVETFAGVPGSMGGWFSTYNPRLLAEVMRFGDFGSFWQTHYRFEQKLDIMARITLFKFRPFFWKERIRRTVIDAGTSRMTAAARGLGLLAESTASAPVDLVAGGGIRTDKKGVALVREQALATKRQSEGEHAPAKLTGLPLSKEAWEASEIGLLAKLVEDFEGELVFFEAPLHSIYREHYRRITPQPARAAFDAFRRHRRAPLISMEIALSDDDFPDISHLRKSMAADFARSLAREWLTARRGGR